jgi:hypothetical protein
LAGFVVLSYFEIREFLGDRGKDEASDWLLWQWPRPPQWEKLVFVFGWL